MQTVSNSLLHEDDTESCTLRLQFYTGMRQAMQNLLGAKFGGEGIARQVSFPFQATFT